METGGKDWSGPYLRRGHPKHRKSGNQNSNARLAPSSPMLACVGPVVILQGWNLGAPVVGLALGQGDKGDGHGPNLDRGPDFLVQVYVYILIDSAHYNHLSLYNII